MRQPPRLWSDPLLTHHAITFVLHNNENFALPTGQASALTPQGNAMNTSPNGMPELTLSTIDFVFSLEPTFRRTRIFR